MSKPRPKIEIVSAQPMHSFLSDPSPPRPKPTIIRPSPSPNPTASPSTGSCLTSPAISDSVNTSSAFEEDIMNANTVPSLPVKSAKKSAIAVENNNGPNDENNGNVNNLNPNATVKKGTPPPRPAAPPKAPARAKKIAKQHRADSPVGVQSASQRTDSPVSVEIEKDVVTNGNDVTILKSPLGIGTVDEFRSTIPKNCAPPPPPPASHAYPPPVNSPPPPPVPPHVDDYDPDTYEYMEPIDSLHRPPFQQSCSDDASSGPKGVATEWKPVSPVIGGPSGEGFGSGGGGEEKGGPPKPRRSFKGTEIKEEPTRFVN